MQGLPQPHVQAEQKPAVTETHDVVNCTNGDKRINFWTASRGWAVNQKVTDITNIMAL